MIFIKLLWNHSYNLKDTKCEQKESYEEGHYYITRKCF